MKTHKSLLTHLGNELSDLRKSLEEFRALSFLLHLSKEDFFDQVGVCMSDLYTGLKELKAQDFSRSSEKLHDIANKVCRLTEQIFL